MTAASPRFVDSAVAAFLRPPVGPAAIAADAIRVIGLLSLMAAIIAWNGVSAAVFSLALLGQVAPRFLDARPGVDLAIGLGVYVSAASNVVDLYTRVTWWDIPVHIATTGLLALLIVLAADRSGVVFDRRRAPVTALVVTIGLALSALWEMGEWAGHTYIDPAIYVGYDDTVIDMIAGGLGSALAASVAPWALRRPRVG
ncbi:MAG: hypothetical protein ABWZ77_02870 [Naasia sp.]